MHPRQVRVDDRAAILRLAMDANDHVWAFCQVGIGIRPSADSPLRYVRDELISKGAIEPLERLTRRTDEPAKGHGCR
jgi:hypothetical protein